MNYRQTAHSRTSFVRPGGVALEPTSAWGEQSCGTGVIDVVQLGVPHLALSGFGTIPYLASSSDVHLE